MEVPGRDVTADPLGPEPLGPEQPGTDEPPAGEPEPGTPEQPTTTPAREGDEPAPPDEP